MEINGIITQIVKPKGLASLSNHLDLKVKTNNATVQLETDSFCPVRKMDSIYAIVAPTITNKKFIIKQYMALINKTKENIIANVMIALAITYNQAKQFYDELENHHVQDIFSHLLILAEDWYNRHNTSIFSMFGLNNLHYDLAKLLIYWYKEFNLRQLYILNLTNKEIKSYHRSTYDMFSQAISNPYLIYSISTDKCQEILKRLNCKYADPLRYIGQATTNYLTR